MQSDNSDTGSNMESSTERWYLSEYSKKSGAGSEIITGSGERKEDGCKERGMPKPRREDRQKDMPLKMNDQDNIDKKRKERRDNRDRMEKRDWGIITNHGTIKLATQERGRKEVDEKVQQLVDITVKINYNTYNGILNPKEVLTQVVERMKSVDPTLEMME